MDNIVHIFTVITHKHFTAECTTDQADSRIPQSRVLSTFKTTPEYKLKLFVHVWVTDACFIGFFHACLWEWCMCVSVSAALLQIRTG